MNSSQHHSVGWGAYRETGNSLLLALGCWLFEIFRKVSRGKAPPRGPPKASPDGRQTARSDVPNISPYRSFVEGNIEGTSAGESSSRGNRWKLRAFSFEPHSRLASFFLNSPSSCHTTGRRCSEVAMKTTPSWSRLIKGCLPCGKSEMARAVAN